MTCWVYISTDCGETWTAGFYDPRGVWRPDQDFASQEDAAKRVHYLNGGNEL